MSTDEFPDCSVPELQETFFAESLPARPEGRYRHYKNGLSARSGAIVLFQFQGFVVASAIFTGSERFSKPDKHGYAGALYFDTDSIRIFDPVGPEGIREIWPTFRRFSHVKLSLDPKRYHAFKAALKNVTNPKA